MGDVAFGRSSVESGAVDIGPWSTTTEIACTLLFDFWFSTQKAPGSVELRVLS